MAGAPGTPKLPTPRRLEGKFEDAMYDKVDENSKSEVGFSDAPKKAYEARVPTPERPPATKRTTEDEQKGSNKWIGIEAEEGNVGAMDKYGQPKHHVSSRSEQARRNFHRDGRQLEGTKFEGTSRPHGVKRRS